MGVNMERQSWKFGFLGVLAFLWVFCGLASGADWAQLQNDAARTGYSSEEVSPPYKVAWSRNFQPERVSRHVQAVTHRGKVIVPTEAGNVYALNAGDGEIAWKAEVGSPVEHTAACADGKVVAATLDGRLEALGIEDGARVWTFRPGERFCNFSQAPCIADGVVYIASRQGVLYAVSLTDGKEMWKLDLGAPAAQTAAYKDGRVYIGAEDMRMRAVDSKSGKTVWTSEQLYGQSFKDYHPVVTGGYVLVRPMPAHPSRKYFDSNYGKDPAGSPDNIFQATWGHYPYWAGFSDEDSGKDVQTPWGHYYRDIIEDVKAGKMPEILEKGQDAVIEHYKENPYDQDFFVLKAADGKQAYISPHFHCFSLPGPVCAPAVAGDGTVVIPWIFMSHVWAKFDLEKGRAVEILVTPRYSNGDETLNVSVGGRYLYVMHCEEANAAYTGIFDFETRTWSGLPGVQKRWWQLVDNTESGNNAASISDGKFYHIVFHQIAAFETAK